MDIIKLENITKEFSDVVAVNDITLGVESGQFLSLLGPSGCGKTTLLRCIAGLEKPDRGEIYIRDELVFSAEELINISPRDRDLSMVFQTYAVWPHMSVYENVAYGLKVKNLQESKIKEKVEEVLTIVGIQELGDRFPHELSGGQQQRVALSRALVVEPSVLLMDEPLSNLDARLRLAMRSELRRIHQKIETTIVYVTHDQIEALSMSDRVVVIRGGVVQQTADPITLYDSPANLFVANFVGNRPINLIQTTVRELKGGTCKLVSEKGEIDFEISGLQEVKEGDQLKVGLRPEDITLKKFQEGTESTETKNIFEVTQLQVTGANFVIKARKEDLEITIQEEKGKCPRLNRSDKILVQFRPEKTKVYNPSSGEIIRTE